MIEFSFDIDDLGKPLRITSLKELEPKAPPRWFRIIYGSICVGSLFGMTVWALGSIFGVQWTAWIAIAGFGLMILVPAFIFVGLPTLVVLGYWWPLLALKAAQAHEWLERDRIHWSKYD